MPTHAEQRVLPYTPEQLFALVADIERYPEFLPWCVGARIRERRPDLVVADLIIGFRMFRERFTSRVTLDPPGRIDVTYAEGPFRYLNNHWIFDAGRRAAAGSIFLSISNSSRACCRGSSRCCSAKRSAAWSAPLKSAHATSTAPRPSATPTSLQPESIRPDAEGARASETEECDALGIAPLRTHTAVSRKYRTSFRPDSAETRRFQIVGSDDFSMIDHHLFPVLRNFEL